MLDIKTASDLQNLVATAPIAILDFWAPWCGPCRVVAPLLEKLEAQNPGLQVAKVNVDEDEAKPLASEYGVRGIPTLVLLKDGKVHATLVGSHSLERLQQLVDSAR